MTLVKDFLVYLDGTPVLAPANSCDPTNGPDQLTVINGELYFEVDDGDSGRELWTERRARTGGTVMVADIDGGVEASDLLLNAAACGRAACRAVTAGGSSSRPATTGQPAASSTSPTARAPPGSPTSTRAPRRRARSALLLFGGKLYFTGNDEDVNTEPWVLPLTPTLSIADVSVAEGSRLVTVTVRLLPANPSPRHRELGDLRPVRVPRRLHGLQAPSPSHPPRQPDADRPDPTTRRPRRTSPSRSCSPPRPAPSSGACGPSDDPRRRRRSSAASPGRSVTPSRAARPPSRSP